MSHHLLLLNADEHARFHKDEILKSLRAVHGVHDLQEGASFGSVIRGAFEFRDDRTTVELSDDFKRISLTGTGVAALQLALKIKENLNAPLRAIDTSYTFDVLLNAVRDLDDFQNRVADGEGV